MFELKNSPRGSLLPSLGTVISKYKISAKKSLGQHFLLDTNLTDRIAKIAKVEIIDQPYKIEANLPYNISTNLLVRWLKNIVSIDRMTLMFQKEVADRLVARPSTKDYGRLSIITQWLCEVKIEFNIGRQAFVPPPNVLSSVVTFVPRDIPLAPANWNALEKVTASAFNQRRKMLRSSLKDFKFNYLSLGIDPTLRAENLTVEEFCRLARSIKD